MDIIGRSRTGGANRPPPPNLIRGKREVVGSGNNDHNFSYTYTTEVYGG